MGKSSRNPFAFILFLFCLYCFIAHYGHAVALTTIAKGQSLTDGGGETLISDGEIFELGFFSPDNSTFRYLGIWYHKIDVKTIVWVANRDNPISDKTGALSIGNDGNLVLIDGKNISIWSSNSKIDSKSTNIFATMKNSGNFILSDNGGSNKTYWESFEHPTDTFLPGMKVRLNNASRETHNLVSWKSSNDPFTGDYSMGLDPDGSPQILLWQGQRRKWRSGHWNSMFFAGAPSTSTLANYLYGFKFSPMSDDQNGTYYMTYVPPNSYDLVRFKVTSEGDEAQFRWNYDLKNWDLVQLQPENECEFYNRCGNFGICDISIPKLCDCMDGYQPRFPNARDKESKLCERKAQFRCKKKKNNSTDRANEEDEFRVLRVKKLPDFVTSVSAKVSESCKELCLQNCSCSAYAEVMGIGCMVWTGDLVDIQRLDNDGNLLYVRFAKSVLDAGPQAKAAVGKKKKLNFVIYILVGIGTVLFSISIWLLWKFKGSFTASSCLKDNEAQILRNAFSTDRSESFGLDLVIDGNQVNSRELPMFSLNSVVVATNNFSEENKLGRGGFGPVYKGKLPGGEDIAVKRLSGKSGQGLEELTNEIRLIAKLQHRNLVRLMGCCIEGEEKMLLYEYMPNKSLDFFIFGKQTVLDWKKRYIIIEGIVRGLIYLHRDSRLRIIHRDLKAANILLDADMNPKISDFGLAKMFGGNQYEGNTVRIAGTYGYMSPEYAMKGLFSVKSDVYSFGVLLLEIISGRRNTSFCRTEETCLIDYTWNLWNEGRSLELVDPRIHDSYAKTEVLRCIHIALLCVQDSALSRPDMAFVMSMLETEAPILQTPKLPTFFSVSRNTDDIELGFEGVEVFCSNGMTVTTIVGR